MAGGKLQSPNNPGKISRVGQELERGRPSETCDWCNVRPSRRKTPHIKRKKPKKIRERGSPASPRRQRVNHRRVGCPAPRRRYQTRSRSVLAKKVSSETYRERHRGTASPTENQRSEKNGRENIGENTSAGAAPHHGKTKEKHV